MITKLEQEFFECFNLKIPMVKCVKWDNGLFSHYDDWEYVSKTFKELGLKGTVDEISRSIDEHKQKYPENIKHNGYCFKEGCFVEAFYYYPEITDRRLLEMITSLANALCNYFVPCVDYYNLKSSVLYDCIQNKENEELQYNIQQLFKEEE